MEVQNLIKHVTNAIEKQNMHTKIWR